MRQFWHGKKHGKMLLSLEAWNVYTSPTNGWPDRRSALRVFRYSTGSRIDLIERAARDQTIMGSPLHTLQMRAIERTLGRTAIHEVGDRSALRECPAGECLLLGDNLFLTPEFLACFLSVARQEPTERVYKAAVSTASQLVRDYVQPLCTGSIVDGFLTVELFYVNHTLPMSVFDLANAAPLAVELDDEPLEHLALPPLTARTVPGRRIAFHELEISSAMDFAPLRINTSARLVLPIEHWVHSITANIICGIYSDAVRYRNGADLFFYDWPADQKVPGNIRDLVVIGEDCQIDPSATIIGPTIIGNNVSVDPGVTIVASVLGDNCIVGQGNQLRLSVLEDGVILPPSMNIMLWSFLGRRSIINSQMRFSFVGEECFVGAATCVTDRILDRANTEKSGTSGGREVKVKFGDDIVRSGYEILGAAFGNRCMTCTGTVLYPGRELSPDTITRLGEGEDGALLALIR